MNQVENELKHYGVLGMHWGKHKAQLQTWGKEVHKLQMNNLRHPILTSQADKDSRKAASTKDKIRRALVYQNTNDLKDINARTAALIANKATHAAAKTKTHAILKSMGDNSLKSWLGEAHKTQMNSFKHPILTAEANRASMRAAGTKDKLRRALVYQNTSDLKDVNARTAALIAANKAKK